MGGRGGGDEGIWRLGLGFRLMNLGEVYGVFLMEQSRSLRAVCIGIKSFHGLCSL